VVNGIALGLPPPVIMKIIIFIWSIIIALLAQPESDLDGAVEVQVRK
jgi:hypothetical protein